MLEVKSIRKSFGSTEILKNISLNIEKGEVISVIGPSGSGKTTLLRCMNCLERADSGSLTLDGETFDLAAIQKRNIARIHRRTGFVFQNYNLFANRTALGNVTEGLRVVEKMSRTDAKEKGMALLRQVGMEAHADKYPSQLSGGQQQRVAIARALAGEPKIIYFDEPTSALDPLLIGEVLMTMKDLADSGMTMMVVTHEMSFARNVSTRVLFMEAGTIVEQGPAAQLFDAPADPRTRDFLRYFNSNKT